MLLLALAGCAAPTVQTSVVVARVEVPAELRACPATPAVVPEPPRPRTFDTVIAWGRLNERRGDVAVRALEVCRAVLVKVLGLVDGGAK